MGSRLPERRRYGVWWNSDLGPGHGVGFESVGARTQAAGQQNAGFIALQIRKDRLGRCDASAILLEIGRYKAIPSANQSRFLLQFALHTLSHSCATFQGRRLRPRGADPASQRPMATGVR
jgi:hypothetical protein